MERSSPSAARVHRGVGVGDGPARVAGDQREAGPVGLDGGGKPGELVAVDDDDLRGGPLHRPLHLPQPLGDAVEGVAGHEPADEPDGERRTVAHHGVRELGGPAQEHRLASFPAHRGDRELDELGRAVEVARGERVPHRRLGLPGVREPRTGAAMQLRHRRRPLPLEVRGEHVGEQVVVAVPPPLVVERHHEQVAPLQRLQHLRAAGVRGHRVAQRAGEAFEHGGAEQEVADVGRLLVQHLRHQVVDDVAVVAGEPGDEPGRVGAVPQRERGQLQGGDPSLGAAAEGGDVGGVEVEAGGRGEERGGLGVREAEVGGTDLGEIAAGPQPGEGQRRVGPGADDQPHLRRQPLEQERHPRLDRRTLGEVVVVQHQHDVVGEHAQLVEHHRQHGLDRPAAAEQRQPRRPRAGCRPLQRREHVGPERVGVAVGGIERHPGHRASVTRGCQPGGEQRGLAEAGRRRHQREPGPGAERLLEPGAGDEPVARGRDEELGLDQGGRRHGAGSSGRCVARACMRSPGRPKMLSTSAGPSPVLPNQWGTWVSKSTASPTSSTRS